MGTTARTWISKYGGTSKGTFEDADGHQHEAGSYLNKRHFWRAIRLQGVLLDYLPGENKEVVPVSHSSVQNVRLRKQQSCA